MQLADEVVPVSAQVPVKVPVPLLVNATVPVGVVGLVVAMSVTVAVQFVPLLTTIVIGSHDIVVAVVWTA